MQNNILSSEITSKIPYVTKEPLSGRTLCNPIFFVNGKWESWIPTNEGLVELKIIRINEGSYYSHYPESENDIYFDFLNFIVQRACWPQIVRFIYGIENDLMNLGASLAKINYFQKHSDNNVAISRFISTEIEYQIVVCKSVFDLMQAIISGIWKLIKLLDNSKKKKELPETFRKIILSDNNLRTTQEIMDRYNVPFQLAESYSKHGDFFINLKKIRDDLIHKGEKIDYIFITQNEFAVSYENNPFASLKPLNLWSDEQILPNNLVKLKPVMQGIMYNTLSACNDFIKIFQNTIQPKPLLLIPDQNFHVIFNIFSCLLCKEKIYLQYGNSVIW